MLSSAAALLDGLFEHPGVVFSCYVMPHVGTTVVLACHSSFSAYLILAGTRAYRFGQSLSSSCKDMVEHRPGQ